ncbi:hypothetical protein VPH35_001967 [Triticum aestivum]
MAPQSPAAAEEGSYRSVARVWSSDSAPLPCDPAETVDMLPGDGPWIFVVRKRHLCDREHCSQASGVLARSGVRLVQATDFRRRTHGRCFRCLAPDHKAASCRDPI